MKLLEYSAVCVTTLSFSPNTHILLDRLDDR